MQERLYLYTKSLNMMSILNPRGGGGGGGCIIVCNALGPERSKSMNQGSGIRDHI